MAVTRLVLYLKQDANDRLWLLYCGGVQIYDPESEKSRGPDVELVLELPEEARIKVLVAENNYFELQANRKPCLSCNLLVLRLYPVPYSLLEDCWQRHFPDPPTFQPNSHDIPSLDDSQEQAGDQVLALQSIGIAPESYRNSPLLPRTSELVTDTLKSSKHSSLLLNVGEHLFTDLKARLVVVRFSSRSSEALSIACLSV